MKYIRTLIVLVFIVTISIFNWNCSEDNTVNSYKAETISEPQFDCPINKFTVTVISETTSCSTCYYSIYGSDFKYGFSVDEYGIAYLCLAEGVYHFCANCSPGAATGWVTVTPTNNVVYLYHNIGCLR